MKAMVIVIGVAIVFIGVFFSLATLGAMVSKYEQCKEHMFSETPECNMVEFGRTFSTGMTIIGIMAITSAGAAYSLLSGSRNRGGEFYASGS